MTSFKGGPAAAIVLQLKRAPKYIRVVTDRTGHVDALDQLDDEPHADEKVYAYVRIGDAGQCHIDGRDKLTGKRFSGWYAVAQYKLCETQPSVDAQRQTGAWQAWCIAQDRLAVRA